MTCNIACTVTPENLERFTQSFAVRLCKGNSEQATSPSLVPHLVQICLHELEDNVDILEFARTGRQHDVLNFHDVCRRELWRDKLGSSMQAATWHKLHFGCTPGCRSNRRSLISRRIRVASETWSKTLLIFLMATFCPVLVSRALHTTP